MLHSLNYLDMVTDQAKRELDVTSQLTFPQNVHLTSLVQAVHFPVLVDVPTMCVIPVMVDVLKDVRTAVRKDHIAHKVGDVCFMFMYIHHISPIKLYCLLLNYG